ncbi:Uncharacterised protein [Cronobacter sakazakii]|nr:Uncharacterised protein [Cronobacter sakazakii]
MNSITTLVEARFDPHYHNKYATLMAAGNGALACAPRMKKPTPPRRAACF